MRLLMYVATATKGTCFDENDKPKPVKFQACVAVHLSLLRANRDRLFGYLLFQETSNDPADWGRVRVFPYGDVPNAAAVVAYVPKVHSLCFGTVGMYSAALAHRFSGDSGEYPIDLMVTNDAGGQPITLWMGTVHWQMPCVVRMESALAANGGQDIVISSAPVDEIFAGYRMTAHSLFLTEHQKAGYFGLIRQLLSARTLAQMDRNSMVVPNGFDVTFADQVVAEEPGPVGRVVGYFGRMTVNKGVDLTVKVYEQLYRAGKIDRAVFTAPGGGEVEPPAWAEFHVCGREYLRKARGVKVMLGASKAEGWPIALMEAMAVGVIVVQYKGEWAKGLFPPDYPFLFSTQAEGYVKVQEALARYDEWSPQLMKWVRYRFDEQVVGGSYGLWLQSIASKGSHVASKSIEELRAKFRFLSELEAVVESVGALGTFRWSTFRKKLKDVGRGRFGPALSLSEIRDVVLKLGWRDTLQSEDPEFVRVERTNPGGDAACR